MSSVTDLLKDFSRGDIPLETCLTSLSLLEDQLGSVVSATEIALVKENLITSLAPILKENVKDPAFNDFVVRGAGIVEHYAIDKETTLSSAVEIKNLGLRLFAGSNYAKVRVAGLDILHRLFSSETNLVAVPEAADVLDVEGILVKHLYSYIGKATKRQGLLARSVNKTLGCLCETFPVKLEPHSGTIKRMLVSQLNEQTTSKVAKLDLSIVQGCFEGLNGCLKIFKLSSFEDELKKTLYEDLVKVCVKPEKEQSTRRMSMRAALELFANHAHLFSDLILEEAETRFWFGTLRSWSLSFNSQDHKVGFKCLNSFLKVIGHAFRTESSGKYKPTFAYLLTTFTEILKSKTSTSKEATLAIQGYSNLAAACRLHMGEDQVSRMLMEMINKTEEVFLAVSPIIHENQLVHLPSYVEALSNILNEVRTPVAQGLVGSIQRIVVHLVKQFPKLPIQYHVFAMRAFSRFFAVASKEGVFPEACEIVLKDIIYQSLLETCSHPVVTETDNILEAIVSTKSYFPLWNELTKIKLICGYLFESIVQMLEKLDFTTEMISTDGEMSNDLEINQDSILTDSYKEASSDVENKNSQKKIDRLDMGIKKPRKVKDFTVLANMVDLMSHCFIKFDAEIFMAWFFKLTFTIIKKATSFPEVSSLYTMLSLSLKGVPNSYFIEHDDEKVFILRFLEEVAVVCCCNQIDLLKACLQLILDLPMVFVRSLMPNLTLPLKKIFSVTLPINLVEKGIDSLIRWYDTDDSGITDDVVVGILPCLKHFMNETRSEMLEDVTYMDKTRSKKLPKMDLLKIRNPEDETDYERVQKKMLLFFGALETRLQRHLLPTADEIGKLATAISSQRYLKLNIPFPDVRAGIFLENLLSRIANLTLHSKHRKTRVAACECFHVVVIFVIGHSASQETYFQGARSLVSVYKVMFPALLKLSSDEDNVIKDLFDPLLLQVVHWFTRHGRYEREETMILLESIFDALCDEEDIALRTSASKYFLEFFSWSIKQTPKDLPIGALHHPKSALKRIQGMWVHPDQARRGGASLAFNSIYRQFREEREIVEHFTIELLVHCILSLAMGGNDNYKNPDVVIQTKLCVDHLVRILFEKKHIFSATNRSRRVPKELRGSCLNDLVEWLINWTSRPETEARHKAMEILYRIVTRDSLRTCFDKNLTEIHHGSVQTFQTYVESCNFIGLKGIYGNCEPKFANYTETLTWTNCLITVTEAYTWLSDMDLLKIEDICNRVDFVKSLAHFSALLHHQVLNGETFLGAHKCHSLHISPKEVWKVNRLVCTVVIRILDFILEASKKINSHLANKIFNNQIVSILFFSILAPSRVGFDLAKDDVHKELQSKIVKAFGALKAHLSEKLMFWERYIPDFLQPPAVIQSIWSQNDPLYTLANLKGLRVLDSIKVIELEQHLPSIEEFFIKIKPGSINPLGMASFIELLETILSNCKEIADCTELLSKNCYPEFENIILKYVVKCSSANLSSIANGFKNKESLKSSLLLAIKVAKASKQYNCSKNVHVVDVITSNWYYISSAASESKENFLLAVLSVKHLFQMDQMFAEKNSIAFDWALEQLSSKQNTLKMKNRVLDLLPVLLTSGVPECDEKIRLALAKLAEINFPLASNELARGRSLLFDYTVTFDHLCRALKETGSKVVLRLIVEIVTREEAHSSLDLVRASLIQLISGEKKKLTMEGVLEIIRCPFSMFAEGVALPPLVRTRIVSYFLQPMIDGMTNSKTLESFFSGAIEFIVTSLLLPTSGGTETERLDRFAVKVGCLKLIAKLYGNSPSKDLVHGPTSTVTKKAFDVLMGKGEIPASAKFVGRELSLFLVKKLQSFRADVIDGSDVLKEAFRVNQCEAFNTLMTIIAKLQNQEKFFTMIFKEESSKSEYIWSRIIDCHLNMNFPLELDSVNDRRTKIIAIRKSQKSYNHEIEASLSSHFLDDSSLHQDVTSFDYHESFTSSAPDQIKSDSSNEGHRLIAASNEITLEVDPLNDHECMANLVSLIHYMQDEKIYIESETEKLPGWMEQIRNKLHDEGTHRNIKLFLLRLILNCADAFKPFAKHFGRDILHVIVSDATWNKEEVINYFSLDVIVMMLSWSDYYTPVGSLSERNSASILLEKLSLSADHPRREIVRYLLQVIKYLVQVWKPALNISYSVIHSLFARSESVSTTLNAISLVGIQLESIIVANGFPPYKGDGILTEEKFFLDLANNLKSKQKVVYRPAAEVLGMTIKYYENGTTQSPDNQLSCENLLNIVKSKLTEMSNLMRQTNDGGSHQKFFDSLFHIYKHYPQVVSIFASEFIYNLRQSKFKGESLAQGLEMLLGALRYIKTNVEEGSDWSKELFAIDLDYFLNVKNESLQLHALSFFHAVLPELREHKCVDTFLHYLKIVVKLAEHHSSKCRQKALGIVCWIYEVFSPNGTKPNVDSEKTIFELCRLCLSKGFGDDDPNIVSQLAVFFNTPSRLTDKTAIERVQQMFDSLLHPDQKAFLFIFPDLLMSMTEKSPDFSTKLFENPLDECVFNEYEIDTNWRSQHSSAPQWVQTLSSLSSQSQGEIHVPRNYLRPTQSALSFAPTQDVENKTESIVVSETLLTQTSGQSSRKELKAEKSTAQIQSEIQSNGSAIRIGKRFIKTSTDESSSVSQETHERSKSHFAKQHQRSLNLQEEMEKERRGRRQAQVNLMRKYRIGELPDIQISYSDVIRPLRNLCYFDEQFSRILTVELITSLASTASVENLRVLRSSLVRIINNFDLADRMLVATVLEALTPIMDLQESLSPDEETLQTDKLVSLCRTHELEALGILILETMMRSRSEPSGEEVPKKRPRLEVSTSKVKPAQSDVMCLIKLYKNRGDLQSSRELLKQNLDSNVDANLALSYETEGSYEKAKNQYQSLVQRSLTNQDVAIWKEGYIKCLESLCEWDTLSHFTDSELGADPVQAVINDPWMDSVVLPNFLNSKLHLISEVRSDHNSKMQGLWKTIDGLRKSDSASKKSFEKRFGLQLALLYMYKMRTTDAKFWINRCLDDLLFDWTTKNEFSSIGITGSLAALRRLVQLRNFLTQPDGLVVIKPVQIDPKDTLQMWTEFLNDTSLCLSSVPKIECDHQEFEINGLLQLANESLRRNIFTLSIKMLSKVSSILPLITDDKRKVSLDKKFNLTYFQASALKCEVDKSLPPEKRLNVLYGFLLKLNSRDLNDPETVARMLQVCSRLVKEVVIVEGSDEKEEITKMAFPDQKDSKKLRRFNDLMEGMKSRDQICYKFESIALETLGRVSCSEWTPDKKFYQATIYYDLWEQFPTERSLDLACSLVESHLNAMRLGSRRAMKMFPNLLTFLENASVHPSFSGILNVFKAASASVQPWAFIPWINQILGTFSTCNENLGSVLGHVAVRVSEKYPEAVRFPFQFTLEQMIHSGFEKRPFVAQLKHLLGASTLLSQVLCGFSNLCSPDMKLKDTLATLKNCVRGPQGTVRSKQVLELIGKLKKEIELNSVESLGGRIHSDYSKKLSSELKELFGLTADTIESKFEGVLLKLYNQVNGKKLSKEPLLLKEYSSFLHSFNMSNHHESIEMFGQYGGYHEPDPTRHIKISSFGERVEIFTSIRKPFKVNLIGDNGKSYFWIVKCGEDLRQDQRIQQAFGVANDILSDREERLNPVRTYKVVPISSRLGVLEFLSDTTTYKTLCHPNDKKAPTDCINTPQAFLKALRGQQRGEDFLKFVEKDLEGCRDLKKSFLSLSASLEGFFYLRENFLRSHGTSSIVSWVMSIGDRHADNLLISKISGESIPIDFGHAFGSACFLPVPELVPFRLTPEIQTLMWPFCCSGPLRVSMIQTLQAMVERKDVLMSALSVFIKEPTMDWLKLAKDNASRENLSGVHNQSDYPLKKLKIVESKLSFEHPCHILMEELKHGWRSTPDQMKSVGAVVWGPETCKRQTLRGKMSDGEFDTYEESDCMDVDTHNEKKTESGNLSVENQVDILLELATDCEILSRGYVGWRPWL